LQRRDQESGLVFSWRIPVTSNASFVVAILLVGLISVGLAALVRVRVASEPVRQERQGSITLVGSDQGGEWLEAMAVEAGPFPFRWNPASDPEYSALRRQALREAGDVKLPYLPEPLDIDIGDEMSVEAEAGELAFFPPLPELPAGEESEEPRESTLGVRVVRSGEGSQMQLPRLPLPAEDAVAASGRRFMVFYQSDGRVLDVVPMNPEETAADLEGWLRRGRVIEHGEVDGSLVVESTVEP
ncbi:MAG: hypothetical protein AAGB14_06030, partial [Verrucomicrobiota bacterium]